MMVCFLFRIQNDLRKIVNDIEWHRPEELPAPYEASSCTEEADIEYFKDQVEISRDIPHFMDIFCLFCICKIPTFLSAGSSGCKIFLYLLS